MESQNVCDAISAEVARRVAEWYGPGSVLTGGVARVETRRYSFFLRFLVRDGAGVANRVLVKIPRRPEIESLAHAATEPRSPGAIREYESLLAIDRVVRECNERDLRSIRPLGFLDPWNAFAMEQVEGRALKELVASPRLLIGSNAVWGRLTRIFYSAGRWLASFHENLGNARDTALDAIALRRGANDAIDSLRMAAGESLELESIREALQDSIERLQPTTDRTTVLHGDFSPANILVTPDERVVVLDTHRAASGSAYEDLARLAMDLPTRKQQVLSRGHYYPKAGVYACQSALIRGYWGAHEPDRALAAYHCALAVVRKWRLDEFRISHAGRLPKRARREVAAWIRPYFRRLTVRSLGA